MRSYAGRRTDKHLCLMLAVFIVPLSSERYRGISSQELNNQRKDSFGLVSFSRGSGEGLGRGARARGSGEGLGRGDRARGSGEGIEARKGTAPSTSKCSDL